MIRNIIVEICGVQVMTRLIAPEMVGSWLNLFFAVFIIATNLIAPRPKFPPAEISRSDHLEKV